MTACSSVLVHGDGQPAAPQKPILIPVDTAVRMALAAYLREVEFTVHAGTPDVCDLSRPRSFPLAQVLSDFPGPNVELVYPSASIAQPTTAIVTGGFTPSMLEDSWDPMSDTVLWFMGRCEGTLQVDFWADSIALREALGAQIAGIFNPNEGMSGVHLRLPETYASAIGRFTLITQQLFDPPDAVWAGERRLQVAVRYEAPILMRRRVRPLRPQIRHEDL